MLGASATATGRAIGGRDWLGVTGLAVGTTLEGLAGAGSLAGDGVSGMIICTGFGRAGVGTGAVPGVGVGSVMVPTGFRCF